MKEAPYGASMIVFNGDAVLLVKRGRPPLQGVWSLPGGKLEPGETSVEAALREVFEETGIRPRLAGFLTQHEVRRFGSSAAVVGGNGREKAGEYLLDVYYGQADSRLVRAGDDAECARFVELAGLGSMELTEGAEALILEAASLLAEKP